jgi:hypothetical protein
MFSFDIGREHWGRWLENVQLKCLACVSHDIQSQSVSEDFGFFPLMIFLSDKHKVDGSSATITVIRWSVNYTVIPWKSSGMANAICE